MKDLIISALSNFTLMSVVVAFLVSQIVKILLYRVEEGRWNLWHFFEAGGMPSSHSATVTALTLGVALQYGINTALFTACLVFALVVMYDATGVRRAAGKQAEVLNKIVKDMYSAQNIRELKEILGHDPVEVVVGAVIAFAFTFLNYYVYFIR
jgi:acid phosphatase family membrane protein YuiD